MNQLTAEQMAEVAAHPEGSWFTGPNGERVFVLQDAEALRTQKSVDEMSHHEAIAAGIADMEAGRTQPLAEAMNDIRKELGITDTA